MDEEGQSLAERELQLIGELSKVHRAMSDLLPPATEPLTPDRPVEAKPLRQGEYERLKAAEERLEKELAEVRRKRSSGAP